MVEGEGVFLLTSKSSFLEMRREIALHYGIYSRNKKLFFDEISKVSELDSCSGVFS